jgi:CNT family concentrative nucleoside transporter
MERLVSLFGLFVFIGLAWSMSENRKRVPWRTVTGGLLLQLLIALFALRTSVGKVAFQWVDRLFDKLLGFSSEGCAMVFGPLANSGLMEKQFGAGNHVIIGITITGTIIFVSALSSLLYHYGILQAVVRAIAWVMERLMGTSGSESLAAAANIFVGQTEAPLVVKPYLKGMTRSELLALMLPGMASIAGGVLAVYITFGINAGHLLTASMMSAPAALMMAKLMIPETETSETAAGARAEMERETVNGLDALCTGASDGMKLAINVLAMLIAFVAIVALLNFSLGYALRAFGIHSPQPMQWLCGVINAPFAWLMGVPWKDCMSVGGFLGERIVLNEFVGFLSLGQHKEQLDPRSFTLATYALCGFANFSSIAIQIGGIGALAPERRGDLAKLGFKSMLGGLLACYSTAAMVGIIG